MDSKRDILKRLVATVVGMGLLLANPAHAQVTEANTKQVKDGYPGNTL
jgi:hypothetical protein